MLSPLQTLKVVVVVMVRLNVLIVEQSCAVTFESVRRKSFSLSSIETWMLMITSVDLPLILIDGNTDINDGPVIDAMRRGYLPVALSMDEVDLG